MPKQVSTPSGTGTSIRVPVGTDPYDITVDLEKTVQETLAVINAKVNAVPKVLKVRTYAELIALAVP